MTQEEKKIFAGVLFCPADPALKEIKHRTHDMNIQYNQTSESEEEKRNLLLSQMLGAFGENSRIQGPVYFHYGIHTKIGKDVFCNFNLTVQDDAEVTIGDYCDFGPNITIVTPVHPMLPDERYQMLDENGEPKHLCYAKPVKIGRNCWLGANVVVCPGVTIGAGCTIGAGSVVTRDIPANTFAAGNPCKVIRELTEQDSMKYKSAVLGKNTVIKQFNWE